MISNYKPCGITEFYDTVAREMGCTNTDDIEYDCRKINVAENIQDGFFEFFLEGGKTKGMPESEIRMATALALLAAGPKVDKSLKTNEVEIFDGFIC